MTLKKSVIIISIIIIAIVIGILVVRSAHLTLNEDEQLAYQNAVKMQNMMLDPESFRLYDSMCLLKVFDDDGSLKCTYTVFRYGGANGFGAIITHEAIFKDTSFVMNVGDEDDEDDPDRLEKLKTMLDVQIGLLGSDNIVRIDIDLEKIKNKMGLS